MVRLIDPSYSLPPFRLFFFATRDRCSPRVVKMAICLAGYFQRIIL